MCSEMTHPCTGCKHQNDCSTQKMACANYANKGIRGDHPSHHYWLALEGLNVDQCNARIAAMLKEGKGCDDVIAHIEANYQLEVIPHLAFTDEIRACLVRNFWKIIPPDRMELTDFLG